MSLETQIAEDLKTAMKEKDAVGLNTLRMIRAQIKDAQIAKGAALSEDEVLGILMNAGKKRKEAIDFYQKGNRQDLLEQEQAELEIINKYLPKQMSREEIADVISGIIEQVGATSLQDLGKVMGAAMQKLKGKADGKLIQEIVRERLG